MRYLIMIAACVVFAMFGYPACINTYNYYNEINELRDENEELISKLNSAKEARDQAIMQLQNNSVDVAESNTEIAQMVSMLASSSVNTIIAEYFDGNAYQTILSISDLDDISFFTNDVQFMNFYLSSSDIEETLDAIEHANLRIRSIDIDYEGNMIYLRIPTIFTVQEG
ncbi:hypothetical protein AALB53_08375 [Lachnospiraceae bacterium 47-T17]